MEQIKASHILLNNTMAFDIVKQLIGQVSFEQLAMAFSQCPSGKFGGSLGEFGKGKMVKEFENAAFDLEIGGISEKPVVTRFGVHIIRRDA